MKIIKNKILKKSKLKLYKEIKEMSNNITLNNPYKEEKMSEITLIQGDYTVEKMKKHTMIE